TRTEVSGSRPAAPTKLTTGYDACLQQWQSVRKEHHQDRLMSVTTDLRLEKLILLLSSTCDGEVTAAARAIDRVLRSNGQDWHDVAKCWHAGKPPPGANWRTIVRWCLSRSDCLTAREHAFLNSLLNWHSTPSAKQLKLAGAHQAEHREKTEMIHDRQFKQIQ